MFGQDKFLCTFNHVYLCIFYPNPCRPEAVVIVLRVSRCGQPRRFPGMVGRGGTHSAQDILQPSAEMRQSSNARHRENLESYQQFYVYSFKDVSSLEY